MRWIALAAVVGVCLLVATLSGSAVAEHGERGNVTDEEPPAEVYNRLTIGLDDRQWTGNLEVLTVYPAASEREAAAADDGTLAVAWATGPDRIREVFDRTATPEDELQITTTTHHTEYAPSEVTIDSDRARHGWVQVHHEAWWRNYSRPGENVTIGRASVDALEAGWELEVVYPQRPSGEWDRGTHCRLRQVAPLGEPDHAADRLRRPRRATDRGGRRPAGCHGLDRRRAVRLVSRGATHLSAPWFSRPAAARRR